MTIRKRLTIWYASLLTVIIVALCAVIFAVMRLAMIADIDKTLDETAVLIETNSRFVGLPIVGQGQHYVFEMGQLDVFRASGVEVQVWLLENNEYRLFGASANLANVTEPLDKQALGVQKERYSYVSDGSSTSWRVRTGPIWHNNELAGNIQVAASMHTVSQVSRALFLVMAACCAATIAGSAVLSMWLADRMVRPIEDVTRAAQRVVETKDLSVRLPWHGPTDELGKLIAVFNRMMERLEQLFGVQRQFAHDISHELRTPLTSISGNLQLLQKYGMDQQSLDAMQADTERMSRLVNDLLMLARADYGGIQINLEPIDLDTVVLSAYNQTHIMSKESGIEFKLDGVEPLRIQADSERIKQVIFNLYDNALKHTTAGGSITTGLYREGDHAVLEVKDTGTGIHPEDLPHIFERFYQGDRARAGSDEKRGFGLGLSISKWIVEAHSGDIRAESTPGIGTTFYVQFPLLDPPPSHTEVTRPRLVALRRRANPTQPASVNSEGQDSSPQTPSSGL